MKTQEIIQLLCFKCHISSIKHARLVCWNHVFNVYESVFTAVSLKGFQSFLNKISDVFTFLLTVINTVS